jgi:N-acetylmuramoyl-L-alanine amidase
MHVVIDAGHGGLERKEGSSANNAVGPTGLLEKSLTLDVALSTRTHLAALGIPCTLTRQTDENLGLEARADVARQLGADAFVSIHFNASDEHNAQGTETWHHVAASAVSKSLAAAVQAGMVGATGLRNRGTKAEAFGVLKPAYHAPETAACLVECSFLDRADEEARLKQASYKDALGKALSQSVHGWLVSTGRM